MELKKQIAVDAYIRSFGIVTKAAKVAEISRVTFYDWLNTDKEFKHAIDNAQPEEYKKDFYEEALIKLIKDGNAAAVIFANKTLNRSRGYIERLDVNNSFEAMPEVIILPTSTAKPPVYDEADIIDPTEQ